MTLVAIDKQQGFKLMIPIAFPKQVSEATPGSFEVEPRLPDAFLVKGKGYSWHLTSLDYVLNNYEVLSEL